MKTCGRCNQTKAPGDFYKDKSRPDRLLSPCKSCKAATAKKVGADGLNKQQRCQKKVGADGLNPSQRYHKKNSDKVRDNKRRKKYGLTPEIFNRILFEQGNTCAICRLPDRKWNVDHDHTTGKVRAILCNCCNRALGYFKDSTKIVTAAAEYLARHGKA